jgi:beta-N-acetylglucosaminidase
MGILRKTISCSLALCMVFALCDASAFAQTTSSETATATSTATTSATSDTSSTASTTGTAATTTTSDATSSSETATTTTTSTSSDTTSTQSATSVSASDTTEADTLTTASADTTLTTSSTQTIASGVYTIVSTINATSVVDVQYASTSEGGNVWLYSPLGTANQRWSIEYGSDGYYTIECANSGMYLCVQDDGLTSGTNVCQTSDGDDTGSKWVITASGSGYKIVSALSGMALDVTWGSCADGTNIRVWTPNGCASQTFTFADDTVVASLGQTLTDGTYTLFSMLNETSAVDIAYASSAEDANAWLYSANDCTNQDFTVSYGSDGYYTIKCVSSGMYLSVQDSSNAAGANVCQTSDGTSLASQWVLKLLSDGSYEVISALTGYVLDVDCSSTADGTNIDVWSYYGGAAQHFYFGGTRTVSSGYYAINSEVSTTDVLDIADASTSAGAALQIYSYNGAANQRFYVKYAGYGCYYIKCVGSDLLLTSEGDTEGSAVEQEAYSGDDSQLWIITEQSDGSYCVKSRSSGEVLDVTDGSSVDGTAVRVWDYNGLASQSFTFNVAPVISDGTYIISSEVGDSLALDVEDESQSDGGNIDIYTRSDDQDASERFEVTSNGDGTYTVTSSYSGKVLDVASSGSTDGTNVQQWSSNGYKCQDWIIVSCNGNYSLISACSLKALDVTDGTAQSGTNVQTWTINGLASQQFTFDTPSTALPDGCFYLASDVDTDYVVDVADASTASEANVQLYAYNGGNNQIFYLQYAGDGYYYIRSVNSGMYLDVAGSGQDDGTNVWQYTFNGYDCQKWSVKTNSDGTYTFISKCNGKALDVAGGVAADGTNVRTWTSNGLASQKFVLKTAASSITYEEVGTTLSQMITLQQQNTTASYSTLEALLDPDTVLASYPLEFADLRKSGGLTGDQLESYIESTSSGRSGVYVGYGATFKAAADEYGLNEVYLLSHAIEEGGWGTSTLAEGTTIDGVTYYNFFGIAAVDSWAYSGGLQMAINSGWTSIEAAIYGGAEWISEHYTYRTDGYSQYTLYLMRWDYNEVAAIDSFHQYATSLTWAGTIADVMTRCYDYAGVTPAASYIIPTYS